MMTMFEDLERLDRIGEMLKMLQGCEKIVVAMYLIHEVAEDTGMDLDEILAIMKRAITAVIAMEREEEEDD